MPIPRPPDVVFNAFLASTVRITRRVEVYQNDGITPWNQDHWDRLISGTVSVDYTRDDRRNVDFVLDNWDSTFDESPSGIWYDKVFKFFYGITVNQAMKDPSIIIMEEYNCLGQAVKLKARLNAAGYNMVRINLAAAVYSDIGAYDVIISISDDYSRKLTILNQAYDAGRAVFTMSRQATAAQLPNHIATVGALTGAAVSDTVKPNISVGQQMNSGWGSFTVPSMQRLPVTAMAAGAVNAGFTLSDNNPAIISVESPDLHNRWVHYVHDAFDTLADSFQDLQFTNMLGVALKYIYVYSPIAYWECQIGEFLADTISNETIDITHIAGRDYVKKCLNSKFVTATMFTSGTVVETIIAALAANAGILKTNLAVTGKVLPVDVTYERDVDRWKAMKEIATTAGQELFFDATGTLTLRPFRDPYLTPAAFTLQSGPTGNLIKVSKKASDTSLFNHIVVAGESSNTAVPPVYAESKNVMVGSASSIANIGDRSKTYTSALITTVAQAQVMADQYLKVAAAEDFELAFVSILFPWLEAGDIMENTYQSSGQYDPGRFLITQLSLPLDLSSMTGTGKRMAVVL